MADVDHLSLSTTPVVLLRGEELVSQGTGFYFARTLEQQSVLFLVTNYHVLTGSAPTENKPPIGDNITFQFHRAATNPGDVHTVRLPLFNKRQRPLWIASATTPEADMAVIPLPTACSEGCDVRCISADWAKSGNLKVRPTSNVTLIGYPYGYHDKKNALPIWKTGSVASEPLVDFDGKPLIVIDISAFPGMSGAPAFASSYGMYETEEGATTVGGARRFLGVYASMQMLKERKFLEELAHGTRLGIVTQESLELGHVWKAGLIIKTIDSVDVDKYVAEVLK
jgi:hypothetical protein